MTNNIILQNTYWASVSGGKDSLYMLAHILHNLDRYPLDGVVHFELEIDYPFIKKVIDYMESECKKYNIPFIRIKPRKTWKELYDKYMFPHRMGRWCNHNYKLDCKKQLNDLMKTQNKRVVYYIGLCADEDKRFKDDGSIYPLAELGIYEQTILEWARRQTIFDDYYKYNKRCGCMLCPMLTINEMKYLSVYYPDIWQYYINCVRETEKIKGKNWLRNDKNIDYFVKRINEVDLKEWR